MISALTTPPARDRDSAPNIRAASRDSTTARVSCKTTPGSRDEHRQRAEPRREHDRRA